MPTHSNEDELKQEGYPDSIAAEVYKAKRRATTLFHNDHDDGDTAIYQLLSDLAPLIQANKERWQIEAELKALEFAKKKVTDWRTIYLTDNDVQMSITAKDKNVGDYAVEIRDHLRDEINKDLDDRIAELTKQLEKLNEQT